MSSGCSLTMLVLTSFSMALTSSAALGTSEDDCRDVNKDEDLGEEGRRSSRLDWKERRKTCSKNPVKGTLHKNTTIVKTKEKGSC